MLILLKDGRLDSSQERACTQKIYNQSIARRLSVLHIYCKCGDRVFNEQLLIFDFGKTPLIE